MCIYSWFSFCSMKGQAWDIFCAVQAKTCGCNQLRPNTGIWVKVLFLLAY